ncbi:sensor histidine kinase [Acanthopleuribacter pedis]|uniref:Histidine kinase domain-containing protein n=1 Tax=Acanthopleuribacter pedis TaxID=442870 RepID=A0A8J7Q9B9_9BACT|nr:sensor histidine kinase [Acanthopleuribacter pedis]MBO1320280.1 hypothetical protein [Acanthopleuribacter pedis]
MNACLCVMENFAPRSCLAVICLALLGLTPVAAEPTRYRFYRITPDEGLSHAVVYAVAQDPFGFVWFSTQVGLNRYDGHELRAYEHRPEQPDSFPATNAGVLKATERGHFWLGTWGFGLIYFNPERESFALPDDVMVMPKEIRDQRIQSIYLKSSRSLWLGTFDAGVFHFDPRNGRLKQYQHSGGDPNGLSHNRVWSIAEDRQGGMWFATSAGLNYLSPDKGRIQHFDHDPKDPKSLSHGVVKKLIIDDDGFIWAATRNGLNRIHPETKEITRYYFGKSSGRGLNFNDLRTILFDREGRLWLGTYRSGLVLFDPKSGKRDYFHNNPADNQSLSNNRIEHLFLDRSNVLWISTNGGGVNYVNLNAMKFFHYRREFLKEDTLSGNSISALHVDAKKQLWAGTITAGLNRIDRKNQHFTHYKHQLGDPNSLSDNNIRAITSDQKGRLWVGTYNGGVNRLLANQKQFKRYGMEHGLSHYRVRSMYVDRGGTLWVGGDIGLDRYVPEKDRFSNAFPNQNHQSQTRVRRVFAITEDGKKSLWLGTDDGLIRYYPATHQFQQFRHQPHNPRSLSLDRINVFLNDRRGRLWIGTHQGLNRLVNAEQGIFERYHDPKGPQFNVIFGIQEDAEQNLWLSTTRGITKLNPDTRQYHHFDVHDGLQGTIFVQGSSYYCQSGDMFFGGRNGFNVFRPEQISTERQVPRILLTDITVFNRPLALSKPPYEIKEIALQPNQNMVTFEFSAMDFVNPGRNNYRYKLEGFDADWIEAEHVNAATYTNLDPGRYVFRAMGSNASGVWSTEGVELKVHVVPPFWSSTRVTVTLLVFLFSFLVWRYFEAEKNRRNLEQRVQQRTFSLAEANQNLAKTAEELKKAQHQVIETAIQAGMAEIATDVLHNLGNALNSINTSAAQIGEEINDLRPDVLGRVNELINGNQVLLDEIANKSPHGKAIPLALNQYHGNLVSMQNTVREELLVLENQIELIKGIVQAQERYAGTEDFSQSEELVPLIEDVLRITSPMMEEPHIEVRREYLIHPRVTVAKTKLLHVLRHLINNSCEAMRHQVCEKELRLRLYPAEPDFIFLDVYDNGPGISYEDRTSIFQNGFTTKEQARGFGLHFAANAMREMSGQLEYLPTEKGTLMRLIFPLNPGK